MSAALASSPRFDPGSFRDRSGRVFRRDGSVLRALSPAAADEWQTVSQRSFVQRGMDEGRIIPTERLDEDPPGPGWAAVLRHETIPFISYPYEWSFGMLQDAALLQLELLAEGLREDVILKDSSPYNVQFRGATPVFIDTASFVRYVPGAPWEGYRQFCQQFLYPLMLQAWRDVDLQALLRGRLEGVTPRQCLSLLSLRDLARKGAFGHVFLHAQLEGRMAGQGKIPEHLRDSGFGKELIQGNVSKLIDITRALAWRPARSTWSDYDAQSRPVQLDGAAKEAFLKEVVSGRAWGQVWDFGCNLGRYSRIAAEHADLVLALDSDHLTVERLYQALKHEPQRNILPLVFNIADPSPGLGWRGRERRALPDRGRPDLVLCLAVIHHLVMRENLLLGEVIDWLADLGGAIVIEFVDKQDPQVRALLANRADQYDDYSPEAFREHLGRRFTIRREEPLPSGTRTIFYAEPRTAPRSALESDDADL